MRIFRFYDQGDSGGAAPVAPASAPAPVSQPPVATPPAAPASSASDAQAPAADPAVTALREKLRSQISKWKTTSDAKMNAPEPGNEFRQVPNDVTAGQRQELAQAQTPGQTPAEAKVPAQTPAPTEQVKPAEQAKPETPQTPAEQKLVFFGNEWTKDQVEQYIKYAHDANQNISKLQEREKAIAERETHFKSLSESPDMVLVEELKNNADLRAKVMELMNNEGDPSTMTNMKVQEANNQISALQAEVNSLKAMLTEKQKQDTEAAQKAEQERAQQEQDATIGAVRNAITDALAKAGLPPEMLDDVGQRLVFRVNQGQVPFKAAELIAEGHKIINAQIEFINKKLNEQRQGYVEKKNSAPPPPPVGGGSPSALPGASKDFREATRRATQRVTNALGNLSGGNG